MRTAFHEQLDSLTETVSQMCGLAGLAMERATHALLQADLTIAEKVIGDHEHLARMQTGAEEAAFVLLALQAPVAADLRTVFGSMQNVADAERMGGLALHVAKIARRRHPASALPEEVKGYFAEMGRIAVDLVIPNVPRRSVATTLRWTSFTNSCSPFSWRRNGRTALQPPSMSLCWADFMNASPTTPSRLGIASYSRRPEKLPMCEFVSRPPTCEYQIAIG
jgi:hypothetical protein